MKKRMLSVVLTASMLAFTLAACGSQSASSDTTAAATAAPAAAATAAAAATSAAASAATSSADIGGKLVIWEHTAQMEAPLKAVIEGFNKKYPNVEIEYQIKTSDQYYSLLDTAIQAGETPDLFWTNGTATSNLESYVSQGVVMDLTDKIDLSMYDEGAFTLITVNGKIYAAPTAELGGRTCFYNKDIFKELGLSVPKKFSEFEAMLPKIKDAGYVPISFAGGDPWCVLFQFDPVLSAMHPEWYDAFDKGEQVKIDDPAVIDGYNKMLEWGDAGYYGPGFTGVTDGATLAFSTGEAAMYIDGTWNAATISENNPDLNYGAFHIPTETGERRFNATSSVGFSIAADTQNPDAALAFDNYFAGIEGQTLWINALGAIPRLSEIKSDNSVVNEMADFDKITSDFYTILGAEAKDGEDPQAVWEEDQTKVMSKGLTPEQFAQELADLTVPGK